MFYALFPLAYSLLMGEDNLHSWEPAAKEPSITNITMPQQKFTLKDIDLYELLACWKNEDLTALSLMRGYAELLLDDGYGAITDDQRQAINAISFACQKVIQRWQSRGYRLQPLLHQEIVFETIAFSDVIKEALEDLRQDLPIDKIAVTLSDNLSPITASRELAIAIVILVDYIYLHRPHRGDFSTTIMATLHEGQAINLRIRSAQDLETTNKIDSTLLESNLDLRIANFVIQQHNGKVEVLPFGKSTEFQITIPL